MYEWLAIGALALFIVALIKWNFELQKKSHVPYDFTDLVSRLESLERRKP